MIQQEGNREQTIEYLAEKVASMILELPAGTEASISQLVRAWYQKQGYEMMHINADVGYVWTRDGGRTYAIRDNDQMNVLQRTIELLVGQRKLDFSKYRGLNVGLPYNVPFLIWTVK